MVLKWREVADCPKCVKQQLETPYRRRWTAALAVRRSADVDDDLSLCLEMMSATRRSSSQRYSSARLFRQRQTRTYSYGVTCKWIVPSLMAVGGIFLGFSAPSLAKLWSTVLFDCHWLHAERKAGWQWQRTGVQIPLTNQKLNVILTVNLT